MQRQTQILLFTRSTSIELFVENVINFQAELDYRIINSDGYLIFMLICILFSFPFIHRVPLPFQPTPTHLFIHPFASQMYVNHYLLKNTKTIQFPLTAFNLHTGFLCSSVVQRLLEHPLFRLYAD